MTRALYATTRWFLSVLPVDDAGRRVFDETLADWRKEAALAAGILARIRVAVRGCASAVRGVALVSFREAARLSGSGVPARFGLWLLLPQVVSYVVFWGVWTDASVKTRLLGTVTSTAFFVPAALFLSCAFGRRDKNLPALGTGLVAACIALPLLVWAVPRANEALIKAYPSRVILRMADTTIEPRNDGPASSRQIAAAQAVARQVWPRVPLSFYNDWPRLPRVDAARSGVFPTGWKALQWFSFFGAYVALCLTLPWLAARMRQRGGATTLVVSTVVLWLLLYQPMWSRLISVEWLFLWMFFGFGVPWVPVLVVVLAGLALRQRPASPREAVSIEAV